MNNQGTKRIKEQIDASLKLGNLYRDPNFLDYLRHSRAITQGVRDLMVTHEDE